MQQHAPSGNGTNGDRDARGRFVRGCRGGPGNPFARRVAAARRALLNAATPERLAQIVEALIERAIDGDVAAAKTILRYTCGDVPGLLDALVRMRAAASWISNPLTPRDAGALTGVEPEPPSDPQQAERSAAPPPPSPCDGLRIVADALLAPPPRPPKSADACSAPEKLLA